MWARGRAGTGFVGSERGYAKGADTGCRRLPGGVISSLSSSSSSSSECFPFDPECLSEDFLCDLPPPVVAIVALAVETSAVAFAGATVAVAFAVETAAVALSTAVVEFALDVFVVLPASVFLWWMLES